MKTQKEIIVIKLYLMTILLLLASCSKLDKKNIEQTVLEIHAVELKKYLNKDTLYIVRDNSNALILRRYKQFMKLEDSIKNKMPVILKRFFSEDELANYETQIVINNIWNVNEELDFVKFHNNKENNSAIQISKPVFLSDRNYCMIYDMPKNSNDFYYMPPIKFYENRDGQWIKIYTLPSIMFHNSMKSDNLLKLFNTEDTPIYYTY